MAVVTGTVEGDVAALVLRVSLGGVMLAHGVNHWLGGGKIAGTARWFESLGLRHGRLQAWASVLTEIGAGVLLVLGLLTPLACAAVVAVMLIAGLLAHRRNGFFVFKDDYEYVAVVGLVACVLSLLGPGRVSVDDATGGFGGGCADLVVTVALAAFGVAALLATCYRPGERSDA